MFEDIKKNAYEANMLMYKMGYAAFSNGSASECDRKLQVFAIRPAGVPFEELSPENMCVVTFEGKKVDGEAPAAQDAILHAMLYRKFETIGGISHSYSPNAVSFAQAGYPIPAYGMLHASFAGGEIPCMRKPEENELLYDYEFNSGKLIVEHFLKNELDERIIPAALIRYDAPVVWGSSAVAAVENACILETAADAAIKTILLRNLAMKNEKKVMPEEMLKMQFLRTHEDVIKMDEEE